MKYLFDTDHLSILQRQSGPEFQVLATRIAQHPRSDFALSIVSLHEQVLGCHSYIQKAKSQAGVERGYLLFERMLYDFATGQVLSFDAAASVEFDRLARMRLRVATMDLRIASIALAAGLTLLTRNRTDFGRVPGLTIEDWTV